MCLHEVASCCIECLFNAAEKTGNKLRGDKILVHFNTLLMCKLTAISILFFIVYALVLRLGFSFSPSENGEQARCFDRFFRCDSGRIIYFIPCEFVSIAARSVSIGEFLAFGRWQYSHRHAIAAIHTSILLPGRLPHFFAAFSLVRSAHFW